MARNRKYYQCENCGEKYKRHFELCQSCGEFGYIKEVIETPSDSRQSKHVTNRLPVGARSTSITPLSAIAWEEIDRYSFGDDSEFDRVLGGGLVIGSIILMGGSPGSGKTTLANMSIGRLIQSGQIENALYVSGEESSRQMKMRANRLGINSDNIYVVYDTNLENILEKHIPQSDPDIVVIDSISVISSKDIGSLPNSPSQLLHAVKMFTDIAKTTGVSFILIAQVTKSGDISGTEKLKHMVDAVLYLEGEEYSSLRVLRNTKNRFGDENEIGLFDMREDGLHDIINPAEVLLAERSNDMEGSSITITMDGHRPLAVEIQALVSHTGGAYGTRKPVGVHRDRMTFICPALENHLPIINDINQHDVFVNAIGGIKPQEPAVDLAIALAIVSSYIKIPVPNDMVFIGEMVLTGEIRNVPRIETRIKEASKIGFERVITPRLRRNIRVDGIEIIECNNIADVVLKTFNGNSRFAKIDWTRKK